MVITRAPYRVSFFGGGTDYPVWYRQHGGAVLSAALKKYCYITCRRLLPYFDHRYRVVYANTENVGDKSEIKHPTVKALLSNLWNGAGLEIHYDGEVPARSGLGSSSAFTVGLIQALKSLQGERLTKPELAKLAIHMEQEIMKEAVGSQDQIAAAFGGFNRIEFRTDGSFQVTPFRLSEGREKDFRQHMMLFFSGSQRPSYEIARKGMEAIRRHEKELLHVGEVSEAACAILQNEREPVGRIGTLMDECWKIKRSLAPEISTPAVNEIYQAALDAGATGGKLLGAGGGGFMLFVVNPKSQKRVRDRLRNLIELPVEFDQDGCRVIYEDEAPGSL